MFAALFGQLLLGWLLADFLSGAFHWWEDRFGMPTLPFFGKLTIGQNLDHHARPTAFIDGSTFLKRNRFMIATALVVGTCLFTWLGFRVWLVSLVAGGALVNEIHAWAHRPSMAPAWARPLQEVGVISSPKQHAAHHRPPHERNFCILTDWLNPLVDAAGLWPRAERFFGRTA